MPRFADLRNKDIDFINKHRDLILGLLEELFEDGVIGRKEWEIVEYDSRIRLRQNPELGDKKIEIMRNDDDTLQLMGNSTYSSYGSHCYCNEDDLEIAIRRFFGSKQKTKFDSQSEEEREAELERVKQEKIAIYGESWEKLQIGSIVHKFDSGFDGNWKLKERDDLSITFTNSRTINKSGYSMVKRTGSIGLSIFVLKSDKPLGVRLRVSYRGGVDSQWIGSTSFLEEGLLDTSSLEQAITKVISKLHAWEREKSIS